MPPLTPSPSVQATGSASKSIERHPVPYHRLLQTGTEHTTLHSSTQMGVEWRQRRFIQVAPKQTRRIPYYQGPKGPSHKLHRRAYLRTRHDPCLPADPSPRPLACPLCAALERPTGFLPGFGMTLSNGFRPGCNQHTRPSLSNQAPLLHRSTHTI